MRSRHKADFDLRLRILRILYNEQQYQTNDSLQVTTEDNNSVNRYVTSLSRMLHILYNHTRTVNLIEKKISSKISTPYTLLLTAVLCINIFKILFPRKYYPKDQHVTVTSDNSIR